MKKTFYTLSLFLSVELGFGQLSQPRLLEHPNIINNMHFDLRHEAPAALNQCDSNDLLDYSSLTEVISLLQGDLASSLYAFNTGLHPIYVQPMSDIVDNASSGDATYMGMAFNLLTFQDYPTRKLYSYPLDSSTITVNGLLYGYQYTADTVAADGLIANDSLVFTFYSIDNSLGYGIIDTVPAGQAVISGNALASLYTGPTGFAFGSIPAHVSFSQGQGFFVEVQYLNKDSST